MDTYTDSPDTPDVVADRESLGEQTALLVLALGGLMERLTTDDVDPAAELRPVYVLAERIHATAVGWDDPA